MPRNVAISSVAFKNFKALRSFTAHLGNMNVLVGPNNAGKSTFLSAFRLLAAALRRAHSKRPEPVPGPSGRTYGYPVSLAGLPLSTENIRTDFDEVDAKITFKLSNKNSLVLFFPQDGGCYLIPESDRPTTSPSTFKTHFPITIGHVPVLGPVEHEEELLQEDSVRDGLLTHRASRYFRNYWYHYPDDFELFSQLVKTTWPGMEIERPSRVGLHPVTLAMFARENRVPRELYWSGFGFQVWCQALTHVVRSRAATVLVVDEPDIYLHPDLQRQLLTVLRDAGPDVLLATHSAEIIGEADPSDILVINKKNSHAQRLKTVGDIQSALDTLGSGRNITLTQLARSRRVLFVEGDDFKILARFAQQLGLRELASGIDLTVVPLGGFSNWERVRTLAWGFERVLGQSLSLAALFDRDYRCDEESESVMQSLSVLRLAHMLDRKEIENYLLIPAAIHRAIKRAIEDKALRAGLPPPVVRPAEEILREATESLMNEVMSQYVTKRIQYLRPTGADPATIASQTLSTLQARWSSIDTRMQIVPGKLILAKLNELLATEFGISLTTRSIIAEMKVGDIPVDLAAFLRSLDTFRTARVD